MPSGYLPRLYRNVRGKTVHILRFDEKCTIQKSVGIWRLLKTRSDWLPSHPKLSKSRLRSVMSGWSSTEGQWRKQTLPASNLFGLCVWCQCWNERHIVIHSLTCSALVELCGNRFAPKIYGTVENAHAWFCQHRLNFVNPTLKLSLFFENCTRSENMFVFFLAT